MALPRKGLRGVEKMAEIMAWTKSMAESGGTQVKDQLNSYALVNEAATIHLIKAILINYHSDTKCMGVLQSNRSIEPVLFKDTRHSERLSKGMEG